MRTGLSLPYTQYNEAISRCGTSRTTRDSERVDLRSEAQGPLSLTLSLSLLLHVHSLSLSPSPSVYTLVLRSFLFPFIPVSLPIESILPPLPLSFSHFLRLLLRPGRPG